MIRFSLYVEESYEACAEYARGLFRAPSWGESRGR